MLRADARVWFGTEDRVDLVAPEALYLTLPRGVRDNLTAKLQIDDVIRAPLASDTEVGTLLVEHNGERILESPIVADREVARAGFFARLWDSLVLFLKGLFS